MSVLLPCCEGCGYVLAWLLKCLTFPSLAKACGERLLSAMEAIPGLIYQDEILLHAAARKFPQPRECLGVPGAITLLCSAPLLASAPGQPLDSVKHHTASPARPTTWLGDLWRGDAPGSQLRCGSLHCHWVLELQMMV